MKLKIVCQLNNNSLEVLISKLIKFNTEITAGMLLIELILFATNWEWLKKIFHRLMPQIDDNDEENLNKY